MPKAGAVTVSIRPVDAVAVVRWLKSLPPPLWRSLLLNVPLLPNGVRVSIFDQFQAYSKRKRRGGGFSIASMELSREDAAWFAMKVQRGMFGALNQKFLPPLVALVCRACVAALAKRSGRPKYRSQGLDAAIVRQKRNVSDPSHPVDPRWMKRLKQRKKYNDAMAHQLNAADGLWGGFLAQNSP